MQFLKACCNSQGDCVICSFSVFDVTLWPLCEIAKTYAGIAIFRKNSKNEVSELPFRSTGGRNGKIYFVRKEKLRILQPLLQ